jgi:hypothetical protein
MTIKKLNVPLSGKLTRVPKFPALLFVKGYVFCEFSISRGAEYED